MADFKDMIKFQEASVDVPGFGEVIVRGVVVAEWMKARKASSNNENEAVARVIVNSVYYPDDHEKAGQKVFSDGDHDWLILHAPTDVFMLLSMKVTEINSFAKDEKEQEEKAKNSEMT